jgi:hypothetical protein
LQVLDFVQAEFAILMIFGFFLMTAEDAEARNLIKEYSELCVLSVSVVNSLLSVGCGMAAL